MKRAWLALGLLLASCGGSPHTHFYTLDPVPPAGSAPAPSSRDRPGDRPIVVGRVLLPPALDRLSLVTRIGPDQLAVSDTDRWAASLDGLVRDALAADLAARLPAGRVIAPGEPPPAGAVRRLDLDVQDFTADRTGQVRLDARWTLLGGPPPHPQQSETETVTAAAAGPTAAVEAMSQALGKLADRIAARLR